MAKRKTKRLASSSSHALEDVNNNMKIAFGASPAPMMTLVEGSPSDLSGLNVIGKGA